MRGADVGMGMSEAGQEEVWVAGGKSSAMGRKLDFPGGQQDP